MKVKPVSKRRVVADSKFRAQCQALIEHVSRTGERVLITKHGKPVAELVPYQPPRAKALGCLNDSLYITGDIIAPVDVEWEALG